MNLFVVCSPLQLINAYEAKAFYKIKEEDSQLVILNFYGKRNIQQIEQILEFLPWTNIVFHHIAITNNKLKFLYFLRKVTKRYSNNFDIVFIGEYFAFEIRAIVNSISFNRLVLFDDGNASIKTINHLLQEKTQPLRRTFREVAYKLFGLNVNTYKNISIFTTYAFLLKDRNHNFNFDKNNYDCIKSMNTAKIQGDHIYFLGVKFVEKGLLDFHTYKMLLHRAINFLKRDYSGKIYYIPHRGEDDFKLQVLEDELDIELFPLTEIIELHIIKSSKKPKLVTTFFSSAIFSLNFIFEKDINLKTFFLRFGQREPASYKELEKLGIEIVKEY